MFKKSKVPIDLSVKAKGTMIGALFLIDFMFFERVRDRAELNQSILFNPSFRNVSPEQRL
jgi:hypothetical protein